MISKEEAIYYSKYTVATYTDIVLSLPIFITKKISKGLEKILKFDEEHKLHWNSISEKSPIIKKRANLREKLDTIPGVKNITNNLITGVFVVGAGIPIAELGWDLIYPLVENKSKFIQYSANSLITLKMQMTLGYSIFMISDVYLNKKKYINKEGKIKAKKVYNGFVKAFKSYLPFDIIYSVLKIGGQMHFLSKGQDPGYASALADSIAIPIFYSLTLALGLHSGLIETKHNKHKHIG